jgi:hypothetical protein
MIREHDVVILTTDLPAQRLRAGDVGTVVHLYARGEAAEVEFVALDGETMAVVALKPSQVRPAGKREIPHARSLART